MNRWEDNIKMTLKEVGYKGMNWIHLVQGRIHRLAIVSTVMRLL
jgi:hypothetical protein